ncbi:MAG: flippase-like domain-containing protein [Flavisolibacter sp.]|nr:flippase-like domain-containing protein [Flavisolibacter sp.]
MEQISASMDSYKVVYLLIPLVLIFFNWGLEAWKWQLSVAPVHKISFFQSFKAVLSGVTFSVTMPNRVGEYLGRVVYLPEGSRLKTISVTLVGSFAQLLTTLLAGLAGLIVLKKQLLLHYTSMLVWYQFLLYGLMLVIVIMMFLYFNVKGTVPLFNRWFKNKKYLYLVEALSEFKKNLLLKILVISIARYFVFLLQYITLFYFFGVDIPALTIAWLMTVVFLALAIIPSISLIEPGLRGEVSLKLIGLFSSNSLGIGITSIMIWIINLVFPAIIGSLLLLNHRIFKRRENTQD